MVGCGPASPWVRSSSSQGLQMPLLLGARPAWTSTAQAASSSGGTWASSLLQGTWVVALQPWPGLGAAAGRSLNTTQVRFPSGYPVPRATRTHGCAQKQAQFFRFRKDGDGTGHWTSDDEQKWQNVHSAI